MKNAARVSIHDKHRMIAGVKQNGIGRFGANAVEAQKFCSQFRRRLREHSCKRAAVPCIQKRDESLQACSLLAKISGGADERFELCKWNLANAVERQGTCATQ